MVEVLVTNASCSPNKANAGGASGIEAVVAGAENSRTIGRTRSDRAFSGGWQARFANRR